MSGDNKRRDPVPSDFGALDIERAEFIISYIEDHGGEYERGETVRWLAQEFVGRAPHGGVFESATKHKAGAVAIDAWFRLRAIEHLLAETEDGATERVLANQARDCRANLDNATLAALGDMPASQQHDWLREVKADPTMQLAAEALPVIEDEPITLPPIDVVRASEPITPDRLLAAFERATVEHTEYMRTEYSSADRDPAEVIATHAAADACADMVEEVRRLLKMGEV